MRVVHGVPNPPSQPLGFGLAEPVLQSLCLGVPLPRRDARPIREEPLHEAVGAKNPKGVAPPRIGEREALVGGVGESQRLQPPEDPKRAPAPGFESAGEAGHGARDATALAIVEVLQRILDPHPFGQPNQPRQPLHDPPPGPEQGDGRQDQHEEGEEGEPRIRHSVSHG